MEKIEPYVELARNALCAYIKEGTVMDVPYDLPVEMTIKSAGAFVSIKKNGDLRGCIGTISPTTPSIAMEIISNAISAATSDPRFSPITSDELPYLTISVDILKKPEPITSIKELDVKKYGVIVTSAHRRGLLLPNLDGVDSAEQQVSIALQKAGIGTNESYSLERFEVVRHK